MNLSPFSEVLATQMPATAADSTQKEKRILLPDRLLPLFSFYFLQPSSGLTNAMSRKTLIAGIKLTVLDAILILVGWHLHSAWHEVGLSRLRAAVEIDWSWLLLACLRFAGELATSAAAWLWLLRRLKRSESALALHGAYFFSQLGKYIPGKIMLLALRLERTRRHEATGAAVTLSTLMENAAFMVSGAATAVPFLLLFLIARNPAGHHWLLWTALSSIVVLLAASHPAVFYRILNPVLRRLGRAEIAPEQHLSMKSLLASVVMMNG